MAAVSNRLTIVKSGVLSTIPCIYCCYSNRSARTGAAKYHLVGPSDKESNMVPIKHREPISEDVRNNEYSE